MTTTNASNNKMAAALSEIGDSDQGTLFSWTGRKKGLTRGPKSNRQVYNDEAVHALIWTGFSYEKLVERSVKKLAAMMMAEDFMSQLAHEATETGVEVTLADVMVGVQEVRESLMRVVDPDYIPGSALLNAGADDPECWEPLVVNGVPVRGSKVYIGKGDPTGKDHRAPKKGTVYITGVKLGERVLRPATAGRWETKRKPKTIVKSILRRRLPIGLYVSYALEPGRTVEIKVASEASAAAQADGVQVDPEVIRSLFKIES